MMTVGPNVYRDVREQIMIVGPNVHIDVRNMMTVGPNVYRDVREQIMIVGPNVHISTLGTIRSKAFVSTEKGILPGLCGGVSIRDDSRTQVCVTPSVPRH